MVVKDLILYPCKNYDKNNMCCRGFYDNIINPRFQNVKINPEDLDKNCKGESNISLCVWFLFDIQTGRERLKYGHI